jgi:hypothetical protein
MNRIVTAGILLAAISMVGLEGADAQTRLPVSLDARVDAAIPTGTFADVADTGWGFSLGAALQVAPAFGVYGAFNRAAFSATAPAGGDFVDSGFSVGVSALLAGLTPTVLPWVGAGLLVHSLQERPATGPATTGETNLGFEVGAGIAIEITPPIRLTPGVHYRHRGASFGGMTDSTVSYLTAGAGINIYF